MTDSFASNHAIPELLSFGQAGRLTGKPKAYLKELAESGQLSVWLQPANGETKLRVTRSGLAEAGLLEKESALALPERGDVSELIALVREQANRISALEEQRFQLGAQLGAAVERVASLEDQFSALVQIGDGEEPVLDVIPAESNGHSSSFVRSLIEVSTKHLKRTGGIRSRLTTTRLRLPARAENKPES